jgi:hypothetical protein
VQPCDTNAQQQQRTARSGDTFRQLTLHGDKVLSAGVESAHD